VIQATGTLYLATVLIWGSTWFAIKFQIDTVASEASVVYRFAIAAAILLAWCRWRGLSLRFGLRDHAMIAVQGLCLFSLNYLVFYHATALLTTGLIAVVFSTILVMNIFNGALFLGRPIEARTLAGAALGLVGIALVFLPELRSVSFSGDAVHGLILSIVGTLLASWGNIASARNQQHGISVISGNALGMAYGTIILFVVAVAVDTPFSWDGSPAYVVSLLYLSVFGSVLAFGGYLTLLGRIGPERAAYAMVLFPIVALAISTVFEGYRWTPLAAAGVALILSGNVVILGRPGPRAALAAQRAGSRV
jgi:drug/metabolite transporter (DMT)-like permease